MIMYTHSKEPHFQSLNVVLWGEKIWKHLAGHLETSNLGESEGMLSQKIFEI